MSVERVERVKRVEPTGRPRCEEQPGRDSQTEGDEVQTPPRRPHAAPSPGSLGLKAYIHHITMNGAGDGGLRGSEVEFSNLAMKSATSIRTFSTVYIQGGRSNTAGISIKFRPEAAKGTPRRADVEIEGFHI